MNSAPVPPAEGLSPLCIDCPVGQPKVQAERRRYPRIRAIVDHPVFGGIIVVLILLSVVLILGEAFGGFPPEVNFDIEVVNDGITMIFVVELLMRWLVSPTTGVFFRRHWIDVVAVLPLLRVFRLGRVFQLIRIVRIFSLATVLQRRLSIFGTILEGRTVEYAVILSFMFFAVIFGGVGFSQYEVGPASELKTPGDAIWKSIFTLLSGEYASYPASFGGKIVFAIMLLFGMGTFAMLTGTFSALMIQKLKENAMQRTVNPEDLNGHFIICGFSAKIAILVSEISSEPKLAETDILIVSQLADINELRSRCVRTDRITIMKEDFTQMDTLLRAGIKRARSAIILSEHVRFRPGAVTLDAAGLHVLGDLATFLSQRPEFAKMVVQGHTDDVGPESFNLALSRRRADEVIAQLVARGVAPARLRPEGQGENAPLDPRPIPAARRLNRRVQLLIEERLPAPLARGEEP